jgi:hypothetical protein
MKDLRDWLPSTPRARSTARISGLQKYKESPVFRQELNDQDIINANHHPPGDSQPLSEKHSSTTSSKMKFTIAALTLLPAVLALPSGETHAVRPLMRDMTPRATFNEAEGKPPTHLPSAITRQIPLASPFSFIPRLPTASPRLPHKTLSLPRL